MAKLTAWLVTVLGLWLVLGKLLPETFLNASSEVSTWTVAVVVLVIGIGKLMRNYKK